MHAYVVRLSSLTAAAVGALALSSPAAYAGEGDAQFLSTLADLGIVFATSEEAIAAGNNVCDIVAEGSANNVAPVEIQSAIVNSMTDEGLSAAEGAQLMSGAVAAYCPQYGAVVGS